MTSLQSALARRRTPMPRHCQPGRTRVSYYNHSSDDFMKKFDIIMFNMSSYSEWERGVSNRNYHILKELLTDPRVGKIFAIDYPPLTLKRALRNYKENNVMSLKTGKVITRSLYDIVSKISDRLYVYSNIE